MFLVFSLNFLLHTRAKKSRGLSTLVLKLQIAEVCVVQFIQWRIQDLPLGGAVDFVNGRGGWGGVEIIESVDCFTISHLVSLIIYLNWS